jgi:hypothetical protein
MENANHAHGDTGTWRHAQKSALYPCRHERGSRSLFLLTVKYCYLIGRLRLNCRTSMLYLRIISQKARRFFSAALAALVILPWCR